MKKKISFIFFTIFYLSISIYSFELQLKTDLEKGIEQGSKIIDKSTDILQISPPIAKFTINGNNAFSSSKLKALTKLGEQSIFSIPQFSQEEFERDEKRIKSFYNMNGFLFVSIATSLEFGPRKAWVNITFNITEGAQTSLAEIKFNGIHNFLPFEIESQIKSIPNTNHNPFQIQEDKKNILKFYYNHGYIYATVKNTIKFNENKTCAYVTFEIEENQLVYVDKIKIEGLTYTKEKIVTREIELEEGDVLLWQKITDTQKNINNLGIFSDITFEPELLDETKNRLNLVLRLKEQPPRSIGFGLGYGTIDKERFSIEWSHDNLFGINQRINFSGTFSFRERLYQGNFINPRIFDTKNNFIASAINRVTRYTGYKGEESATSAEIQRKLTRNLIGSAKYKLQLTRIFDTTVEASLQAREESKNKPTTQSFTYTLIYDNRDSLFYPLKGIFQSLSYQYAGGILKNNIIKSDISFQRYIYNGSVFYSIWKELVFAYRLQIGVIKDLGQSQYVPVTEKFRTGGVNSIRGYGENEMDAPDGRDAIVLSNIELRFPIYKKLYGAIFYDGGQLYDSLPTSKEFTLKRLRHSQGVGLRYHTAFVPFRIDYAQKIAPEPGVEKYAVYISIGQAF